MNKQEAIERIRKFSEYPGTYPCAIVRTPNVIEVIKCIDETQKVKVPEQVGEDLDILTKGRLKEDLVKDICFAAYDYSSGTPFDAATIEWCQRGSNLRTMIDAIWNGYEVEDERKYVVKVDKNAYFVDFFDSLTPHLVDGLGYEVMRFKDKPKAWAVATIIDGTVEKV